MAFFDSNTEIKAIKGGKSLIIVLNSGELNYCKPLVSILKNQYNIDLFGNQHGIYVLLDS